ncbi:MAG: YceI family protein [Bacteroidota bacterium]
MKSLFQCTLIVLALGLFMACGNSPEGEAAQTSDETQEAAAPATSAVKYTVDTQNSSIMWTGTKLTGSHTGTIKLSGGEMAVAEGNLTAGSFEMDMNTIENTDLKAGEGKEDLEGHLKTGDFFEVEKFPSASFVITGVSPVTGKEGVTHSITGNLTLKGEAKSVTFDANVAVLSDRINAVTPAFTINRTEWGINFKSGILGTVKDKAIADDISLVINLVANPT